MDLGKYIAEKVYVLRRRVPRVLPKKKHTEKSVLPPFQFVVRFDKFIRYIDFIMFLNIPYIYMYSKIYIFRYVKTTYNLRQTD